MSFQARAPVAEGAKWEPKVGEECEGVVFSSWPHNPSDTLRGRIYQFAEHKGVMCASIAGFFCHPDSLRPISPPPAQPTTAATEAPRDTQPEATGREGGGSPEADPYKLQSRDDLDVRDAMLTLDAASRRARDRQESRSSDPLDRLAAHRRKLAQAKEQLGRKVEPRYAGDWDARDGEELYVS